MRETGSWCWRGARLGTDTWDGGARTFLGKVADAHNSISSRSTAPALLHVAWDHHVNAAQLRPRRRARLARTRPAAADDRGARGSRDLPAVLAAARRRPAVSLSRRRVRAAGRSCSTATRWSRAAWKTVQRSLVDGEGQRSPYWDMAVDRDGTPSPGVDLARVAGRGHEPRHLLRALDGPGTHVDPQRRHAAASAHHRGPRPSTPCGSHRTAT